MIETRNPATGELLQSYALMTEQEIADRLEKAHLAYSNWRLTGFQERKEKMLRLADLLRKKKDTLSLLMAREMGKPVTAGQGELEKCAWVCEHYAEHAEQYLAPRYIETEMKLTKVCYRPLGIVFAIMPWNFPFWQVFRFVAPTLMAGNGGVLSHAPISTGTGNAIAQLIAEAGYPEFLFQHFVLDNELSSKVIANPRVIGVTLTGSERAGMAVAATAGAHLKKTVMELGGSDPYVILADADLSLAAKQIVGSRMNNCGQVCIAAKRVIVVPEVVDELRRLIIAEIEPYKMGDPLHPDTRMGPMARKDLRETLHDQVQRSIAEGATLVLGGDIPAGPGYYYPPTLLVDVQEGTTAFTEELFGPVICLITAKDEADALRLANQTPYGLAAAVFTRDLAKGEKIATEVIEAGACFVNSLVASDPRVPFGGIKRSGYGRELSREGILEFVNTKIVSVK